MEQDTREIDVSKVETWAQFFMRHWFAILGTLFFFGVVGCVLGFAAFQMTSEGRLGPEPTLTATMVPLPTSTNTLPPTASPTPTVALVPMQEPLGRSENVYLVVPIPPRALVVGWDEVEGAESYLIFRSERCENIPEPPPIGEISTSGCHDVCSYVDKNIEPGGSYRYTVAARRGEEVSFPSPAEDPLCVTIPEEPARTPLP